MSSLNLREAFGLLRKCPDAWKKILIGGVLMLVPVIQFASMGYLVVVYRRAIAGVKPDKLLPEWEGFGDFFFKGASVAAFGIIYLLVFMIPAVVCLFIFGLGSLKASAEGGGMHLGTMIPSALITMIFSFLFSVFFSSAMSLYAESLEVASAFKFINVLERLTGWRNELLKLMGLYVVLSFVLSYTLGLIPFIGMFLSCIATFAVSIPVFYALGGLSKEYFDPVLTDPISPEFLDSVAHAPAHGPLDDTDEYGYARPGSHAASYYHEHPPETSLTWSTDSDRPEE